MAESFLEEQIRRIREMSARISESHARGAELARMLEQTRSRTSPLETVRDLTPYEHDGVDDDDDDAPVHRRLEPHHLPRAHKRRRRR